MAMGLVSWFGDRFKQRMVQAAEANLEAVGAAVAAEARRLCPVDTGQLRASIGYTFRQDTHEVIIHADQWYAVYVEFGTSRQKAQPFLRPALLAAPRFWGGNVQFQTQVRAAAGESAKIPQAAREDSRFNIRQTDTTGFPLAG